MVAPRTLPDDGPVGTAGALARAAALRADELPRAANHGKGVVARLDVAVLQRGFALVGVVDHVPVLEGLDEHAVKRRRVAADLVRLRRGAFLLLHAADRACTIRALGLADHVDMP